MTANPVPLRILVIDHDPVDRAAAEQALFTGGIARGDQAGYHVESVTTLAAGLRSLSGGGFDAVLLELSLPDSDGIQTLRRLRASYPDVPVVVLTRLDDAALGVQAVQAGAQDFLVKERIHPHVLVRVVRYACERHRVQSAELGIIDSLTQLYSLRGFTAVADQVFRIGRRASRGVVVLVVKTDATPSEGAEDGDGGEREARLLRTGALLRTTFRASDVIGRIGPDLFGVVAVDAPEETISRIIERVNDAVGEANAWPDGVGSLTVGATPLGATETASVVELIARASRAMPAPDEAP